jgi:methylated-DNA-[protein]-cysteine S-methyltransferase
MVPIIYFQYYKTTYGELIVGSFENQLCLCDWRYRKQRNQIDSRISSGLKAQFIELETKIIHDTIKQLDEYFMGKRTVFDLELIFVGSDFQKSVWHSLIKIPYGKTVSYLTLSKELGNEKAIRAVANANGANAISIIVPCHRIVGSNGALVGYAGGLNTKKKLITLERSNTSNEIQLSFDF